MAASIPHILLPQRPLVLQHVHYFRALAAKTPRISATCRYASARTPKHQVLEKPTKFNPPSHGRRLKEHIPRHYGPELTQQQKVEQKQKQYPRMMPPPGTFMFWFLTNRNIHTWITLSVLGFLASLTMWENWCRSTVFRDRLPSKKQVLFHPIDSFSQAWMAYRLNIYETSIKVGEVRKRGVDDAQKRASYRRAHGCGDDQGMQFWPPYEERARKSERPISEIRGEKKKAKVWFGIW